MQQKLHGLKEEREQRKQELIEKQQDDVTAQLTSIEEMIANPLKGMLKDSKGEKRSYAEVEAFVLSRRKQEDMLLKKLRADETQQLKDEKQAEVNRCKEAFDEKLAVIKADRMASSKKKEAEAEIKKQENEKAEAEAKTAESKRKKAEAEAKKAHFEAKKNTKT